MNDHEFILPNGRGGAMKLTIPDSEMKVCPCGCDLFRVLNKVAWIKPQGILDAKPACMRVEVFVCDKCGSEIGPETHSKRAAALEGA